MALQAVDEYDAGRLLFTCFESLEGEYTQLCCQMGLEEQSNQYRELEPARAAP